MRDFIVGLHKAATERRPGATADELQRAAAELRVERFPEELALLYGEIGGADFVGDVSLHPLFATEETTGVVEQSRLPLPDGLPAEGVVRFGLRGGAEHLFAVPGARLDSGPAWLSELQGGAWVYGVKNLDTGAVKFYRALDALLSELIPPVQAEGFGENTFIRAFNAVQSALETATTGSHEAAEESAGPKRPSSVKKAQARKAPVKKASARKAPVKKASARKAPVKKAAARKAPAKKASARKSPAKKPAARKSPARRAAKKAAPRRAAKKSAVRKAPAKKSPSRRSPLSRRQRVRSRWSRRGRALRPRQRRGTDRFPASYRAAPFRPLRDRSRARRDGSKTGEPIWLRASRPGHQIVPKKCNGTASTKVRIR